MAQLKWIAFLVSIPMVFGAYSIQTRGSWNSACNETNSCNFTNSQCLNGYCTCSSGYVVDYTKTKCLKVANSYYDSCEDDKQCTEFLGDGATCEDKKCVCKSLYHYLHGRCHKTQSEGDFCKKDDDCYDGTEYQATSCNIHQCGCSKGFYQRTQRACRRRMKNIGDECLLDHDCQFTNGTCVSHKCVLNGQPIVDVDPVVVVKQTLKKYGGVKIGDKCKNNTDCQSIGNSICDVNGTCICGRAHFPSEDKTGCIPEIGEACDPTILSLKVEHAVCRENMWTCPIDRISTKDNRECKELVDGISGSCNSDDECRLFGPSSGCLRNKCRCVDDSYYDDQKHYCWNNYKDSEEQGNYCRDDSECGIANSHCQNNTCVCDMYHKGYTTCYIELYADCENDSDCRGLDHAICHEVDKTCQCRPDFVAISSNECKPKKKYHEDCYDSKQCSLPHTVVKDVLHLGYVCECEDDYIYRDGECVPKKWLSNECTGSDECVANSRCRDGTCQCRLGHSFLISKCVPSLGSNCENHEDCNQISNSQCQNNTCVCLKYHFELDGQCVAGLHGNCQKTVDCKDEDIVCEASDNKCHCDSIYVLSPDGDKCLPISSHHENCEHNVQCSAASLNLFCNATKGKESRCECTEKYYHKENKCILKKYVNEECTQLSQCFTKNSYCNEGHCECHPKFPNFVDGGCNSSAIARP